MHESILMDTNIACLEGLPRQSDIFPKKNTANLNCAAKMHLNKLQDFWNKVLWKAKTKVEMFGHYAKCHVWRKPSKCK